MVETSVAAECTARRQRPQPSILEYQWDAFTEHIAQRRQTRSLRRDGNNRAFPYPEHVRHDRKYQSERIEQRNMRR